MDLNDTGCCAVTEICHLSEHGNAEGAMREFIRQVRELEDDNYDHYDYDLGRWVSNNTKKTPVKLGGHYIFTGVVTQGHKYGQNFATYIRRHKLGRLTESQGAMNRINHPDHRVKVWVWSPSPKGVQKWVKKYMRGE